MLSRPWPVFRVPAPKKKVPVTKKKNNNKKNNAQNHNGVLITAADLDVLGCSSLFGMLVMMFLMSFYSGASASDHGFTSNDSPQ